MVLKENLKLPITPSGRDSDAPHNTFDLCGRRVQVDAAIE
jgi:hypothetical protein